MKFTLVTESISNLKLFFIPKLKLKISLLNWVPGSRSAAAPGERRAGDGHGRRLAAAAAVESDRLAKSERDERSGPAERRPDRDDSTAA